MDTTLLKKLEFEKIKQELAKWATSDLGKAKAQALEPYTKEKDVQRALQETQDAVEILRLKGGIPNPMLKDISAHLKRLDLAATLSAPEIAQIGRVLTSTKQVVDFFDQQPQDQIQLTQLPKLVKQLIVLTPVARSIQTAMTEEGYILDDASSNLKSIRNRIKQTERSIKETLDNLLKSKQAQLSDTVITMRNERYVLPVKQEYRNSFGGLVHDQSASGQTLFMEPKEVLALNNRLTSLQSEEKEEIARILYQLCLEIKPYTGDILINHRILGELNFINAKALYAKALKAEMPAISSQNHVKLLGARHPLIDPKVVVKNDILIGQDYQTIVITGPNTGGKTILLKTLGLLQLMGQAGLHLPVAENSQIGIFTQVFADIGDEQSIEQNLSTFSSHMTKIVDMLEKMDDQSLVLFDELGSGTDPQEGAALAMAILDHIGTVGAYVVATTHYPELKLYGYNRPLTTNASMEFDSLTLAPTYKFLLGIPGRSNALDISRRLGLAPDIVDRARLFINEDAQEVNDMITELEKMRQQAVKTQEQAAVDLQEAQALLERAQKEKEDLDNNRLSLENQAKRAANQLVEEAQAEAERLISEIRQMQLQQGKAVFKEHEFIEKRTALSNLKHQESLKQNKVLKKAKRQKALVVGDQVEVMSYGQRGTIEQKLSQDEFVVKMGVLKMKVKLDDLRLIDQEGTDKKRYIPSLKGARSKVTTTLDLRGKRYEEALVELDRYLDAAILAGYAQVTIVHGRGTGAVREGVIKQLKKHKGVLSFAFAPINQGGNGATIAQLK